MRNMIEKYGQPAWAPPDPAAPGADPKAGDPKPGDTPPAFNYPANLPVHLKGDTPEATVTKMLDAYLPLRAQMDKVPKAPEKADLYALSLEGSLAGYSDTLKNDPLMPKMREIAHKHGMSQDMFQNVFSGILNEMHNTGAFAPMPSDGKIAEAMIDPALQGVQRGEAVTAATKRLTDARAFVDSLKEGADGGFSVHERAELAMMSNSAGGVALIERLQKMTNQTTVKPAGESDAVANLQAEYDKRLQDPKNASDPAFAAATREMSKKIAGMMRAKAGG
jgi:hypothetical protein